MKRKPIRIVLAVLLLTVGAWFFLPRPASTRVFDPVTLASQETRMWQAYYAKDYWRLGATLWETARTQFGGSPWDDCRIAWHAARAADIFQASKSRAEAEKALPNLVAYYRLLANLYPDNQDPETAARLELEWWQLRREDATDEEIAAVIAQLYALVYNMPEGSMLLPAATRVEAMDYRDARRKTGLTEQEWATLQDKLVRSYQSLKDALDA